MNLRQLSLTLGLSQTTVSRALNGYPEVSEATRERVIAAARKHNYAPNTRARGLATGRAMAIAHVISTSGEHDMVNPIFGDFIAGAAETYGAANYDMLITMVERYDEADVYRDLHAKRSVDGLIVQAPSMDDARIDLLTEIGLPFVVHGRASRVETPYSFVDVRNERAFERATEFLLDLGHRRIALLNGLEHMDFASRRRRGYVSALAARGIEADPGLMFRDDMTETYGWRVTRELIARKNRPSAILASSLITALGVRRAIEDAGLKMGSDISVITFDDALSYLRNGDGEPIFTATRSSVREAGRLSARMLLDLIAEPDTGPRETLLEPELVLGPSTGILRG